MSSYSGDHIAGRPQKNGIKCNTEETQVENRLGTVSNRLLETALTSFT